MLASGGLTALLTMPPDIVKGSVDDNSIEKRLKQLEQATGLDYHGSINMETRCVIKELVVWQGGTYYTANILLCREDNTYERRIITEYEQQTMQGSAIEITAYIHSGNYYPYISATALKDGYYSVGANAPALFKAGDTLSAVTYYSATMNAIAYCGVQVP